MQVKPKCLWPVSTYVLSASLDDGATNHLNGREADFGRARVQATAQGKRLRLRGLPSNVPAVDSNRWRARECKVRRHRFIRDEQFAHLRGNTFRIENVSHYLHGGRMDPVLREVPIPRPHT